VDALGRDASKSTLISVARNLKAITAYGAMGGMISDTQRNTLTDFAENLSADGNAFVQTS